MSDLDDPRSAEVGLAIADIASAVIDLTNRLDTMNSEHAKDMQTIEHVAVTYRKAHSETSNHVGEMMEALKILQNKVADQEREIVALQLERVQSETDAIKADTKAMQVKVAAPVKGAAMGP